MGVAALARTFCPRPFGRDDGFRRFGVNKQAAHIPVLSLPGQGAAYRRPAHRLDGIVALAIDGALPEQNLQSDTRSRHPTPGYRLSCQIRLV